mgnify:FL=1|tara:strand:+ start:39 stop:431 length:393 start_codon:yes stop_codon:yes gene_type:complete
MEWYLRVMRDNYANFSGRARRREYWMFTLVYMIILIACTVLDNILGTVFMMDVGPLGEISMGYGWVYTICGLMHFIPGLAVVVRRLHDVGKSGWFYLIILIPFIGLLWLLILYCTEGPKENNKWGPDPKA